MRATLSFIHRSLLLAAIAGMSIGAGNPSPGAAPQPSVDALALVNPYIGVDWYGQAFLGATVPFGMVKVGPDMESYDGRASKFGYLSGGQIWQCAGDAGDGTAGFRGARLTGQ